MDAGLGRGRAFGVAARASAEPDANTRTQAVVATVGTAIVATVDTLLSKSHGGAQLDESQGEGRHHSDQTQHTDSFHLR